MRRPEELAARVDDRKADAPLEVHLLERQPDRVAKRVLDHAANHVEEVDEVDDAGRIAVREADQPLALKRLWHERMRLNQASDSSPATSTSSAAAAEKKAPISVFLVSMTRRECIVW